MIGSPAQQEELLDEYQRVVRDLLRWAENDKRAPHAVVVEARARGVLAQHEALKSGKAPEEAPPQSTNRRPTKPTGKG